MKLKVRCPVCTKLYEVQGEDIQTDIPVFQCVSCDNRFAFEFTPENLENLENIATFLVSAPEEAKVSAVANASRQESVVEVSAQQEMKSCPKCGALNGRRSHECYSCHVLFDRLEGLPSDPTLKAQPSLVRKWKNLLGNFSDEKLHEEFVLSCQALDALRFAMMKYEEIRTAQGGDVLCDQMIARINSLMMVGLSQKPLASKEADKEAPVKWRKYLFWGPYAISAILILAGMLNLGQRNLIGLGVAIACMTSGLIVMIRGKISVSDFID
ncbi:hypothetical protein D3C87_253270 [compost metagenome]